ncbi:MAG TPA: TonB-dependent receptor [Terriglobia bacterium]|nr:TonB-dependent receptor [Terriglobia bacterium]
MNYRRTWVLMWLLAGALISLGLAATPAVAQVVKGSISGTVVDSSAAVVPGADIKLTELSRGEQYTSVTDATGLFHIALISIGTYKVEISKEGFRALEMTAAVQASQDTGLGTVTLQLGTTTTTVEVTGASPIVQTTQAQITNTVTTTTLQSFPGTSLAQGMDFLALQVPGVVSSRDNNMSNSNGVGFTVNGIRGRNNDQQIDGQNNNDNSVAGPYIFLDNPDFVSEYQIVSNNFGPEYGRNSGSVVNYITKSGTNDWHGNVFVTEGNWRLNTLSNTQKAFEGLTSVPVFNNLYTGATIGGPIKKDKLFIFGGYAEQINNSTSVYGTGSLTPTPAGLTTLQSCFPGSASIAALAQYGPFGITGGNPTPSGTPTTKTLTAADGTSCDVPFAGVQRTLPTNLKEWDSVARIDWNGVKDHVYGRWIYQKVVPLNLDPGTAAAGYPYNVPGFGEDFGASWTHTLSSSMVNEMRLSYGRMTAQFGGNGIGNTIPNQTNLGSGLSSIIMPSGYLNFGPPNNSPQGRVVNTYQLQDNWSYFHGKHQFKAGTNLTYQRSPNVFLPNYNGTYNFSSFQAYAENLPSSISITLGSPTLDFREHDSFFYFGDDIKATSNLTLNLGLTYTYFGQPANLFHTADTRNESSNNPFFDPALPLSVRTFPSLPAPKNQFGPSAGFAYSLDGGKLVFRGGYRLAFDPPFYNIYLNIASSAPQVLAQTLSGSTAQANPLLAAPFGPAVRSQLAPYLTLGVQDPRNFNQTTVTPNFGPDHVQSWSFGVQRQILPTLVAEARYVGNHGANLFQSVNANPYVAGLQAAFPNSIPSSITPCSEADAIVSRAIGRVNCNLGIERLRTNTGVSDYQALQTELRATNLARQLTLRTAYTWSKTTDNVSEVYNTLGGGNTIAFSQDPLNYVGAEHGLSGLNIPHSWTMSFVEQLPFYRDQHGVAGRFLGGWTLSGTYLISSGEPYTPVQFAINTYSGGGFLPGGELYDSSFNAAFIGVYETARPFAGSPTAPISNVGIYAADACNYLGVGCSAPANQLISFNAANTTGAVQTVARSQVRFIANGLEANTLFGTPFGSVGRNTVRDFHTNSANFSLAKDVKISERFSVQWRMDMLNVFNHPNYASVDTFLDDAGYLLEGTGFGVPSLTSGGNRSINFQLKLLF